MAASRRSPSLAGLVLGSLGLAFGAGSLAYPLGRDQGLYFYVAREWVLRGAVPYRDVLDHKTPGIYLLYALGVRLFGEALWPIRLFDLAAVVAVGLLAAAIAIPRGEGPLPGARGFSVFSVAVLYYGFLDYWNTAQSELWYSMLALGAVWAARRIDAWGRACLVAGVFSGAALFMKPPAMWLVGVALALLAVRGWTASDGAPSRRVRLLVGAAAFGLGGLVVPGPVLAYFASKHAIGPMLDIVVGANAYYVEHERGVAGVLDVIVRVAEYLYVYAPLSGALPLLLVVAYRRARAAGDAPRLGALLLSALLLVAGFLAVWMQKKFYLLHWTVILGPVAVATAVVYRDQLQARASRPLAPFALAGAFFVLYLGAIFTARGPLMWLDAMRGGFRYHMGQSTREKYTRRFDNGLIGYSVADSEALGEWLAAHTTPDDLVTVRGFEPEIYATARRRHGGRFFWTTFITNPQRAYRRAEWLAEDLRDLTTRPPKYIVTLRAIDEGPDWRGYYVPLGYAPLGYYRGFDVLERDAERAKNWLFDGSFEVADPFFPSAWQAEPSGAVRTDAKGRSGARAAVVDLVVGQWRGFRQGLVLPQSLARVCASAWVRGDEASAFLGFRDAQGRVIGEKRFGRNDDWTRVEACADRPKDGGVYLFVGGFPAAFGAHLYVDDLWVAAASP